MGPNEMSQLPAGFVMDDAPPKLPDGFTLDQPNVPADIAKSAGIGVAKGAIGMAGLIPDVAGLAQGAANKYLIDPLLNATIGLPKSPPPAVPDMNKSFGSAAIQSGVEKLTGDFYQPKTMPGQYAQTVGEFAPGVMGGGAGLARRAIGQVVAPAIASETAGQVTKGTDAEPYARVAGALLGGIGGSVATRAKAAEGPSLASIEAARNADYAAVNNLGVTVRPQTMNGITNIISHDLAQEGLTETVAPRTLAVLERLGNNTAPLTITEIDNNRKILGQLAKGASSPNSLERIDAGAARRAINALDETLPNLQAADLASGAHNHAQAIEHLVNARGNAAASFKMQALDRAAYNATNNAAAANSGANGENALRQQLKSILNNPGRASQFSAAERAEMQRIVRGEGVRNAIRTAGNLLGGGGGIGAVGTAVAGHMALPGIGLLAPVVGKGLKMAGNSITQGRLNALGNTVRSNSPLGRAAPPQQVQQQSLLAQAIINAALARQSGGGILSQAMPAGINNR